MEINMINRKLIETETEMNFKTETNITDGQRSFTGLVIFYVADQYGWLLSDKLTPLKYRL